MFRRFDDTLGQGGECDTRCGLQAGSGRTGMCRATCPCHPTSQNKAPAARDRRGRV
jgi:hypothetical protein